MAEADELQDRGPGRAILRLLCVIGAILPVTITLMRFRAGGNASDFWSFWHAGRAALAGAPIYGTAHVFPYPPPSLFLFLPFAVPPFGWGLLLFNCVGVGFFAWAAKPYLPKGVPLILAVCSPATLLCLFFGQSALFLGALWLLAFRGRWAAVAALSFKPHLGALSVLSLRGWRQLAGAIALTAFISLMSVVIFGAHVWIDFAHALLNQADTIGRRSRWLVMGVSPAIGYGVWGWIGCAVAASVLLARSIGPFTAATAALLISPYGFAYDMPVASLGFAIAICNHWQRLGPFDRAALVLGYLTPLIVGVGTWWAPPILLCALWVQSRLPECSDAEAPARQVKRSGWSIRWSCALRADGAPRLRP